MKRRNEAAFGSISSALVCCPERHILRLIEVNLERQGFRVKTTNSGQEAIDYFSPELPSLLVLDADLTNPNYREIIAVLRKLPNSEIVRVIVLGSRDGNDDLSNGEGSTTRFVKKPFNVMDLA